MVCVLVSVLVVEMLLLVMCLYGYWYCVAISVSMVNDISVGTNDSSSADIGNFKVVGSRAGKDSCVRLKET